MSITDNLSTWIDATDTATITTSGTVSLGGITYNTISSINDKSGNNKHFTVPVDLNKPIYIPSVTSSVSSAIDTIVLRTPRVSNKPALLFIDSSIPIYGNSKRSSLHSNIGISGSHFAYFGVYQTLSDSNTFGSSDTGDFFIDYSDWYGVNKFGNNDSNPNYELDNRVRKYGTRKSNFSTVFVAGYVDVSNVYHYRLQGQEIFSDQLTSTSASFGPNNFQINGRTNGETAQILLHELLIYNRRFTGLSQIQEIEGYLAHKWGMSLPPSHPYYSNPPNTILNGSNNTPVCFLGSAPILTPTGYRRIDSLCVGDIVQTADGRCVPIQRVKTMLAQPGPGTDPFIIPAGHFGATASLPISPRHRVAVPGRGMIEARNIGGLERLPMRAPWTYYNIELPHWETDNMVVSGVTVESLAPVERIRMPLAIFKSLLLKKYGAAISNEIVVNRILATCRLGTDGMVEAPVISRR